jgi:hypothetical protein
MSVLAVRTHCQFSDGGVRNATYEETDKNGKTTKHAQMGVGLH